MLAGAGGGATLRTFETHASDGTLGYVRARADGSLARVTLTEGGRIAEGTRELYSAPQPLALVSFALTAGAVEVLALDGDLLDSRLLAPATTQVTFEGTAVPFVQDGDYVVFGSFDGTPPTVDPAAVAGEESGCDCALALGQRRSPWPTPASLALAAFAGALLVGRRGRRLRGALRRWRPCRQSEHQQTTLSAPRTRSASS
jgi:hypothetical protein